MSKEFYSTKKREFLEVCEKALALLKEPNSTHLSEYLATEITMLMDLVKRDAQPPKPPRKSDLGQVAFRILENTDEPLGKLLRDISKRYRRFPPTEI